MPSSYLILNELQRRGVTHVLSIPDNTSAALLRLMREEGSIPVINPTREGEAFAIASGLWVGGKKPVVLIQSTGFLESGDALRGTAMRMRVPLVCLITYRGYLRQVASGISPAHWKLTPDNLSRPDLDSCAMLLEPTLEAWGVPYDFLHKDEDIPRLAEAFDRAEERQAPVALLITRETT